MVSYLGYFFIKIDTALQFIMYYKKEVEYFEEKQ